MQLTEIKEIYADYVLKYTKKDGNGLDSLVSKLEFDKNNALINVVIQKKLIHSFSIESPAVDLVELDEAVKWILITSFAKLKENNEWKKTIH